MSISIYYGKLSNHRKHHHFRVFTEASSDFSKNWDLFKETIKDAEFDDLKDSIYLTGKNGIWICIKKDGTFEIGEPAA